VGNASRIHALNESTIFYHGAAQRVSAENLKAALNQSGSLIAPVRTQIREATAFYPAEPFHQDYYRKTAVARSCPLD
jgi:peptide-methionine (S)-S-oxide reductase